MDLVLWRHADAEGGIPDAERRLTLEGRRQAERIAEWLRPRLRQDRIVLVSPARRAQETARALADSFSVRAEVGTTATPQSVLEVAGWPDREGSVVVVGHQPTLGQAAALALCGKIFDLDIEKGALWWLVGNPGAPKPRLRLAIAPDML